MTMLRASALSLAMCAAALLAPAPSAAQDDGNWARDFVNARVAARNLQAVPLAERAGRMGDLRRSVEGRIVGGADATAAQNPFQVALLLRSQPDAVSGQYCGGALASPTRVVTAAHCVDFLTAGDVAVLAGTRDLSAGGSRANVARIVLHPSWNATTFDNDVAVLHLAAPIGGVATATMAATDGPTGGDLLVTGWGRLTQGGASPTDLQAVTVPLVSRTNCNDANSYGGRITGNMICAGFDAGGRDSCQGDSGGPLTRGAGNGTLTGIVSWGWGCARPNLYGVYTRVSAPGVSRFIADEVAPPLRDDCIGFDNANLRVRTIGGDTKIVDGDHWLMSFGDKRDEAERALAILRHYRADRSCFVGRPGPSMTYVLAGADAPSGAMAGEDCIRHDLGSLTIRESGSRFTLVSGTSAIKAFPNRREAEAAIRILRDKGADRFCYVGRPGPSFTYVRR